MRPPIRRLGIAFALLVAAAPPDDPRFVRAKAAFEEGVRYLDAGELPQAVLAFQRSLDERESLPALFNLALAYQALGKPMSALPLLDRHKNLAEASSARQDLERGERLREQLVAALARVHVRIEGEGAELLLDGRPVTIEDPLLMDPGAHVLEARRKGFQPDRMSLDLAAGSESPVELHPTKPVLAKLFVDTHEPSASIRVDRRVEGAGSCEVALAPGAHEIEVVDPNGDIHPRTVSIEPGAELHVVVDVHEPPRPIIMRWWFWAGLAAVASIAAGGAAFALTRSSPDRGKLGFTVNALDERL